MACRQSGSGCFSFPKEQKPGHHQRNVGKYFAERTCFIEKSQHGSWREPEDATTEDRRARTPKSRSKSGTVRSRPKRSTAAARLRSHDARRNVPPISWPNTKQTIAFNMIAYFFNCADAGPSGRNSSFITRSSTIPCYRAANDDALLKPIYSRIKW
jgi:hypothetical protein